MRYCIAIFAAITALASCSTPTTRFGEIPSEFESRPFPGGSRLVLQCSVMSASVISCDSSQKGGERPDDSKIKLELLPLTAKRMYLKGLISEAAKEVLESPKVKLDIPVAENELILLKDFVANQDSCLADKEYADLMVLCPVVRGGSDSVVMFLRGLCDKCQFQPVIMRKIKK
jgi:hypothetical protein